MKSLCLLSVFLFFSSTVFAADESPDVDDSINVTIVGTLRTGIVAIGGETTGTTITAKGITWELDLGKLAKFQHAPEKINGKKVIVRGGLELRKGVEIQQRWIVTVTGLQAAGGEVYKSPNGKAFPKHWVRYRERRRETCESCLLVSDEVAVHWLSGFRKTWIAMPRKGVMTKRARLARRFIASHRHRPSANNSIARLRLRCKLQGRHLRSRRQGCGNESG